MRAEKVVATSLASTAGIETLRVERGLRLIEPAEEGFNVYDLPNGVYGFTFAPGLKEVPVYGKRPYHSYEIQKLQNGEIHTIGFVTAAVFESMRGKEAVEALIFPEEWKESTVLVRVPD